MANWKKKLSWSQFWNKNKYHFLIQKSSTLKNAINEWHSWNLILLGKKGLSVKMSMIYHTILDKSGARRWAESFRDANSSSYWLLFKSCCCSRRCNETNELLNFFSLATLCGDWQSRNRKAQAFSWSWKINALGVKTPTSIGKVFFDTSCCCLRYRVSPLFWQVWPEKVKLNLT